MNRINLIVSTLAACLLSCAAIAQDDKYFIGEPTRLPQAGWNKVLCMNNGGTLLFHMEPGKKITVMVYDSLHKLTAKQLHACRLTDLYILKQVIFKGLYDINGEAVLFLEQQPLGKSQLIRLRFSGTKGTLLEEKIMGESQSISRRTQFYVAKNNADNDYCIFFCTEVPAFKECKMNVAVYNKDHQKVKDIALQVDRKKYDYMKVIGFESQPNGICVSLCLSTLFRNSTAPSSMSGSPGMGSIYNHDVTVLYVPKDSNTAISQTIDVSSSIIPYYTHYTYNPFAKTINLLLFSYNDILIRYGINWLPVAQQVNLFLKMGEDNVIDYNWIINKKANRYLKQKTDTNNYFQGLPVATYTNENGLSTMISVSYERGSMPESIYMNNYYTYLGNIAITQFNDDGNEIWGTVLPNAQAYMSYARYYPAHSLSKKWQQQDILNDLPEQVYSRQFISFNPCLVNKEYYLVYNDINNNFNKTLKKPGDTVYDFATTNACYYKMSRKKEITKHYLFGQPQEKEYKACFIEGADYDRRRGVYAALIQDRKGDKVTLRMAWRQLD